MFRLSKKYPSKRAFITGAASGLGKAFVLELAREGWLIGISDIKFTKLTEVADQAEKLGAKVLSYELDTADKVQYERVSSEFLRDAGGIDLLINNAGVGGGDFLEEFGLENWEWIVGINYMGVVHGCHYFLPTLKKQNGGAIINIASAAAFSCTGGMSMYNSTKAAVLSLSETLYVELKNDNIDVSVVMPTFFKTNIIHDMRGSEDNVKMGHYMVNRSGLEPDAVARRVLEKAGKKKLYVILPFQSRMLYHFQRLFPGLFLRMNVKLWKNRHMFRK